MASHVLRLPHMNPLYPELSNNLLRLQMAVLFGQVDCVPSFGIFQFDIGAITEQQADERAFALAGGHVQRRPAFRALRVASPVRIRASRQQKLSAVHAVVDDRRVERTGPGRK